MKKQILALCLALLAAPAFASISSDFKNHFNGGGLASYNKDVSSMLGMMDFHTGRGVTFPGFDIGASFSAVKNSGDLYSKDYMYIPYLTAETKLPVLGVGVAVRGTSYDGFSSLGGGLKWQGSLALIHFSAGLFYDRYGTDYYDGDHYSASASASVNLWLLTPYVGVGYDYSNMKLKDMDVFSGTKTHDGQVRYTVGLNFHPLPLVYVYGAYTSTADNHGFQGGVGLKF